MKFYYLIILSLTWTLIGCATKVPPLTKYSFDVYQYSLNKEDFSKVGKAFNSSAKNPNLIIVNFDKYWEANDILNQESFFSIYKYSNINCKLQESNITNPIDSSQSCKYLYKNTNLNINLTANKYIKDNIYYTIEISKVNESSVKYDINYNINKQYFLFTYKNYNENLLFIIYRNELGIPWNTYKNSPQQYNSY